MPEDDAKQKEFFARRIQAWYRHQRKQWYETHQEPKSFYVLKERSGYGLLKKEEVVKEHIASVLYRLLGIRTPEIRIVSYDDEPEKFSIASQYLNGYKDLYKILKRSSEKDAQHLLEQLDTASEQQERIALFQQHAKDINLGDREGLLVAAVCLMDFDVIGVGFSNIGYSGDKTNRLVKIDPAGMDYKTEIKEFIKSVSLDNELLLSDFSSKVCNDPKFTLVGNIHLLEFFSNLDKNQLIKKIKQLATISDDEIRRHIIRAEYQLLIEPAILETIAEAIIGRKAHLLSLVDTSKEKHCVKTLSLQPIFAKSKNFSKPVHTINRGNAKPVIVYKSEDDVVSSVNYYSL